jgi:hypothetical protein
MRLIKVISAPAHPTLAAPSGIAADFRDRFDLRLTVPYEP